MRIEMRSMKRQAGFSIVEAVILALMLLTVPSMLYLMYQADVNQPKNWGHDLPDNQALQAGLREAGSTSQLYDRSVDVVELICEDSKVVARFAFEPKDGREQVKVTSGTLCREEGSMLAWHGYRVRARENYDVALVDAQLKKFIADAGIKKNEHTGYNNELAKKIHQAVASKFSQKENIQLSFTCKEAQSAYKYSVLKSGSPYIPDGTLKTRCAKAHQNFDVMLVAEPRPDGSPVIVEQYNALDDARAIQAVTEYLTLAQQSVKKTF